MKYKKRVEDKVEVYGKIINLKQKLIDLKQKPKLKGEMTIEASLVMPTSGKAKDEITSA